MGTVRQWIDAAGYLIVLLPPILLFLGVAYDFPLLAFVALIVVVPFLRAIFGDVTKAPPVWSEAAATALHTLPNVTAMVYVASLIGVLWRMHASQAGLAFYAGLGLSLWAVFIFGSCVAHELVHRRDRASKRLGQVLSGLIGYPLLEHEHRAHHAGGGSSAAPEWPRIDESVWAFTARRWGHSARSAWEGNVEFAQRTGRRYFGGLHVAVPATVATACGFVWAGGASGAVTYALVAIVVAWSMHAVTYVQHWGLGDDSVGNAAVRDLGWEDHCRLQAWLTLGISFHQAHHHSNGVPFYRLAPEEGAPRQPGGYVVLLVASLLPPLWRALMLPVLERWKAAPTQQRAAGRRLICINR